MGIDDYDWELIGAFIFIILIIVTLVTGAFMYQHSQKIIPYKTICEHNPRLRFENCNGTIDECVNICAKRLYKNEQ